MDERSPILIAEGNSPAARSMARAFEQADVRRPLHRVSDCVEAIEYLSGTGLYADRSRFPLPCLLITATALRPVGGFDLRVWLQGQPRFQRLPKIVLSSSPEEAWVLRSLTMDSWTCLVMPQTFDGLVRLIKQMRDAWFRHPIPSLPGSGILQ